DKVIIIRAMPPKEKIKKIISWYSRMTQTKKTMVINNPIIAKANKITLDLPLILQEFTIAVIPRGIPAIATPINNKINVSMS
ncbi:MAG: hypothetical protein K5694_02340, partial [Bacilli bacterium]|nr:hypothetical protein [Bacilli bacterium]